MVGAAHAAGQLRPGTDVENDVRLGCEPAPRDAAPRRAEQRTGERAARVEALPPARAVGREGGELLDPVERPRAPVDGAGEHAGPLERPDEKGRRPGPRARVERIARRRDDDARPVSDGQPPPRDTGPSARRPRARSAVRRPSSVPPGPFAPRETGSVSRLINASASSAGSRGGTSRPVTPSSTSSGKRAHVRRHARQPAAHRLDHHVPVGLELRRQHEHRRVRVELRRAARGRRRSRTIPPSGSVPACLVAGRRRRSRAAPRAAARGRSSRPRARSARPSARTCCRRRARSGVAYDFPSPGEASEFAPAPTGNTTEGSQP